LEVKVFQVVTRTSNNGGPERSGIGGIAGDVRNDRTGPLGSRVDWPADIGPGGPPFWDNIPHGPENPNPPNSTPWEKGKEGTMWDHPGVERSGDNFQASTCFVGFKKDGTQVDLGCLLWGVYVERDGLTGGGGVKRQPKYTYSIPTFSCNERKTNPIIQDAVNHWNNLYPGEGNDLILK